MAAVSNSPSVTFPRFDFDLDYHDDLLAANPHYFANTFDNLYDELIDTAMTAESNN